MEKQPTIKAIGFIFFLSFAILLLLNFVTPLAADDFAHFTSWADRQRRMENVKDIFDSLAVIRAGHNGRVIAHFFAIVFLQMPKVIFNFVNAAACTALFYVAFRYFRVGERKKDCLLLLMFIAYIWVLTPAFGQVFLWLTGACNYSWAMLAVLLFLFPYYRAYIGEESAERNALKSTIIYILAFVAGAYSENASCSMLAAAFCFMLLIFIRDRKLDKTLLIRFIVACAGFLYLMLAPSELGTKNAEGGSGLLQKLVALIGTISAKWLVVGLLILALVLMAAIWLFLKHRRLFCTAGAIICTLVVIIMTAFLAPRNQEGLYLSLHEFLSETKISILLFFGTYIVLLCFAILKGADTRVLLASGIFTAAALVSLVVFIFAIYFPARSSCPAAFYTAIANALLISELLRKGEKNLIRIVAAVLFVIFVFSFCIGVADILDTWKQNNLREEVLANSKATGQKNTLLETIECAGKYSVVWPREYANFNRGMGRYYGVPDVWVKDIDFA